MTWTPLWNPPYGWPANRWHRERRPRAASPRGRLRRLSRTFRMKGWLDRRNGHVKFVAARLRAWRPSRYTMPPVNSSQSGRSGEQYSGRD